MVDKQQQKYIALPAATQSQQNTLVQPTTTTTWHCIAAVQHQQNTFVRAATTNPAAVLHKQQLLGFVLCPIGHEQQVLGFCTMQPGHKQSGHGTANGI